MKLHNISVQIFVPGGKPVAEFVCDHIAKCGEAVKLKLQRRLAGP
jgi:hypothetical protein